ncbi:MAG: hypothetical protein ACRD15_00205 [Vicinamibacterales bacterium]
MKQRKGETVTTLLSVRSEGWVWALGFTLLIVSVTVPTRRGAQDQPASSTASRLVPNFNEPLTQYRAFRRMHARSERFNQEGWVSAWTELDQRGFRYEIVSEHGSERVRNKVLKAVLKREQELVAEGPERAALTDDNYVFTEPAHPTDGPPYVLMKPKRKDVVLLDGRIVLSPDGSDVVRIEGRLAKNPSFWTSLVNVTRTFAKVDGVRVPVATESIAKVKFAGQSRLDVSYEYESINGQPVSISARRVLASVAPTGSR